MFPKGFTNRFTCDPPWKFLYQKLGLFLWELVGILLDRFLHSTCWPLNECVLVVDLSFTPGYRLYFLSHTLQCQVAGLQDYPNDVSSNMNIGVWEMHCNMEFTSNYFLSLHQPSFQQCTWSKAMVVGENIMGLVAVILVCVNAWQGLL